jgi:hypothetical protein
MDVPQPKEYMNRHLKAGKMLWKLSQHPALSDAVFNLLQLMTIDIVQVCKNGYTKPDRNGCLDIRYTPDNYKKYQKEFDTEFKEYSKEELEREKLLIRADIPYKKIYGYSWKPDHIEYWGELCFVAYIGKDLKLWHDPRNWQRFSAVEASGRTFEEMVVKLGQKFFRAHGKFTEEDFLTDAEKKNHREQEIFFSKAVRDGKAYQMIPNPKYKTIYASEINRRWVKWFAGTAYGKKRWEETLSDILAGKAV